MSYNYEENKDLCGVYGLICIVNNKIYIGSTSTKFSYRKSDHYSRLRNGKHTKSIQKDYDMYGEESFVFDILFVSDNVQCIISKEIELIDYYKKLGISYNAHPGGEIVGNRATEKTKLKMSESHKGTKLSEYQKQVLAESNRNRKISKETREKLSNRFQGSKSSLAILNEEEVYDIKCRIMNGESTKDIALLYHVDRVCIDNIKLNYRWKHVIVDGWEEYQNKRQKWHKLTEEQEHDIAEKIKNGTLRWHIHKEYGISFDKIKNICKKYNI